MTLSLICSFTSWILSASTGDCPVQWAFIDGGCEKDFKEPYLQAREEAPVHRSTHSWTGSAAHLPEVGSVAEFEFKDQRTVSHFLVVHALVRWWTTVARRLALLHGARFPVHRAFVRLATRRLGNAHHSPGALPLPAWGRASAPLPNVPSRWRTLSVVALRSCYWLLHRIAHCVIEPLASVAWHATDLARFPSWSAAWFAL